MRHYPTFGIAIDSIYNEFMRYAKPIHTEKWQGLDIKDKAEAEMYELMYLNWSANMDEDLISLGAQIKPNLPWADDHFLERVSGEPLNPGEQWKNWPWAHSANRHRTNEVFNHTYMERMWPQYAGMTYGGVIPFPNELQPHQGIRYRYGDLKDVVDLLYHQPMTRQAYLPMFFPEDTGLANPDRKPCSLGYLFYYRDGKLDVTYYIRSCDLVRHFRDDVYLTVRLLLWVLDSLRQRDYIYYGP